MFRFSSSATLIILLLSLLFPAGIRGERKPGNRISDLLAAEEWCCSAPLSNIEGIWEFPEDETMVLIKRKSDEKRVYELILLSSPDCRLHPGECIGYLYPTANSDKYKLKLYISRKYGILSDTRSCSAEYRQKDEAIYIQPRQLKISFRTLWFLPKFWRSLRIKLDDPASTLPKGLRKVYPLTVPENPIYL